LALLVDTSSSVYRLFGQEKQAAIEFLRDVFRPASDRLMIESFNTSVDIVQPFAADLAPAAKAVATIRGSDGLTSFYDALYIASEKMLVDKDGSVARRGLVLIGDGEDNLSIHGLREAIEMAQRADVVVYAISIHAPPRKGWAPFSGGRNYRGDLVMRQIADSTGGRQYVVSKQTQLRDIFREIESELRNLYSVAFRSEFADGRFHSVRVVTARQLTVHCRAGYWAAAP
jgi:VWFA-related protein